MRRMYHYRGCTKAQLLKKFLVLMASFSWDFIESQHSCSVVSFKPT